MHTQPQSTTRAGAVVPFPVDRCSPPSRRHSPLGEHKIGVYVAIARQAELFRDMAPDVAEAVIADRLAAHGADDVARQLDRNRVAIAAFSAILATLIEADHRLAEAAFRALAATDLPGEVR